MRFMLTLLVIGFLVFASYYMFTTEKFKGSPQTQVKQALGIKDKEDPAVEAEVNEIVIKFGKSGLTDKQQAAQRQLIMMHLKQEKQDIAAVLKDKSLTKQPQSGKIAKIQKHFLGGIAFWISSDKEEGKKIEEWLISKERNVSDSNSP
jgi:preprotein translocase subunit SecF